MLLIWTAGLLLLWSAAVQEGQNRTLLVYLYGKLDSLSDVFFEILQSHGTVSVLSGAPWFPTIG